MKKIEELKLIAGKIGIRLSVFYLPMSPNSKWCAYFQHDEIVGEFGFGYGETPEEALETYMKIIKGKTLKYDNITTEIKQCEFTVPKGSYEEGKKVSQSDELMSGVKNV